MGKHDFAVPAGNRSVASRGEQGLSPPIIGFTPNHWSQEWTSRRRILLGLADRGWPTLYSSGARTVWDLGDSYWREQPWIQKVIRQGKLQVDLPGRLILRWPTISAWDHVALAAHGRHLKRGFGGRVGVRPIALLFHPVFWPYVRYLKPRLLIYYACDAYRLMPGWTKELEHYEQELLGRADMVVAYSQGMLDTMPGSALRTRTVLSTGVDIKPFELAAADPIPADLARIPRPRIGYVGRINQKLDYALILEVARQRPEWHWVFIGAIGAYADERFAADPEAEQLWSQCRALPNVHVLGKKPHADVPGYLLNMDVNVMCYRGHGKGWWSEIFPLKSMEYFAAGRPIVSSPVKSILQFSANLAIATTVHEWVNAIEHAFDAGGTGTVASRLATARANTWDQKIDCLQRWIVGSLEDTLRHARS